MALFHSFLWPSNIPLYRCITPPLPRLSADGHLGCFCVLAIVNSVAVNIRVHMSSGGRVFSGYVPRSESVGSYGSSSFIVCFFF